MLSFKIKVVGVARHASFVCVFFLVVRIYSEVSLFLFKF